MKSGIRSCLLGCFLFIASSSGFASIIKRPPAKPVQMKYHEIPCSDEQKAHIHEIVSTVAETSKISLYFKQQHLKRLGEEISDVHPLKFLAAIFSSAHLKVHMAYIWNDYFKRTEFMAGLAPSLSQEMDKGNLLIYLDDFAVEVGVKGEELHPYFSTRSWENLVYFLIHS